MMLKKNIDKMTIDEIENTKVGTLPVRIVYNQIIDNNYYIWLIGNTDGNKLFFAMLNDIAGGTIGFTDSNLAVNYVNRKDVIKSLLQDFGENIVIMRMSLLHLQHILDAHNATHLATILINPTTDFFIPIALGFFKNLVEERDYKYDENLIIDNNDDEYIVLKFDKKEKKYIEENECII